MLRIHLLQQCYDLSNPAMEDALIDVPTMRRFAGIDLSSNVIPHESTMPLFCHLLAKHNLSKLIFVVVKAHYKANRLAMKQGTTTDDTLIVASTPTFARSQPGDAVN
jgi:IS5 family transposase